MQQVCAAGAGPLGLGAEECGVACGSAAAACAAAGSEQPAAAVPGSCSAAGGSSSSSSRPGPKPVHASYGQLMGMRVRELKRLLQEHGVDSADCFEKEELVKRVLERCTLSA